MTKYAIITPTYNEHFKYINKYLKSYVEFVVDKKDIVLYFIISKSEEKEFERIIEDYKEICNIKVLLFENILLHFGIELTPDILLKTYKKFSFQTFKKFYAMLYADADYFLVLDSESMWVNNTNMKKVFDNFIQVPFISGSSISNRKIISDFTQGVIDNVNYLLNKETNKWFLENFVWFYDKKILQDLFEKHGSPIEMAKAIYQLNNEQKINSGIFEIELYQAYVYHNLDKYGYKFFDVNELLTQTLPNNILSSYIDEYNKMFDGNCGLLEHSLMLLNDYNCKPLAEMFKTQAYNIIRCDFSTLKNIKLQEKFINIVQPNILAASQEHAFGINDKYETLVLRNKYSMKLEKHLFRLLHPSKLSLQLLLEPFAIAISYVKWYLRKQNNHRKYKRLYGSK